MIDLRRRRFLQSGIAALLASGCVTGFEKQEKSAKTRRFHVAIVGGGYAGASTARYLKAIDPTIEVTLIEYDKVYATGPASNWVIGGLKSFPSIFAHYGKLKKLGIRVIHDWVSAVDVAGRNLRFDDGSRLGYDRLVLAPGVAMDWDAIEGYGEKTAEALPHGWIPGLQTQALSRQLKEMRSGGLFLLTRPEGDISCPQALYERASLVAHYLSKHNASAKLLLLDAQEKSDLRAHFEPVWKQLYGFGSDRALLEVISGRDARVQRVDEVSRVVLSGAIQERHRADLLNVVPPQKAGVLAQAAGLVDASGWCPVDPVSSESALIPGIHIVGDAADTGLGRHAGCAHQMAAYCARHIASVATEQEPETAISVVDRVHSLLTPELGLSRTQTYEVREQHFEPKQDPDGDGVSRGETEAAQARRVWKSLREEVWG